MERSSLCASQRHVEIGFHRQLEEMEFGKTIYRVG